MINVDKIKYKKADLSPEIKIKQSTLDLHPFHLGYLLRFYSLYGTLD